MKKEKMVKTAKALDTLFKILKKIIIICAAVCIAVLAFFTVVNYMSPNSVIGKNFNLIFLGARRVKASGEVIRDNSFILIYAWMMMAAAIAIIFVVCYAIGIIRKILAPMTQGDPFHPTVGIEIRRLAFATLTIGIIRNLMYIAEVLNIPSIIDRIILLPPNRQMESATVNFLFDPSFLVVFFVLLLMSYIFQYGEELQRLSDETL